jgi:two-component system, cell cycle sensor histidine kinase and response regulator CckA
VSEDKINRPQDINMSFLSKEQHYYDHILDNSRSMISIINREYVYEKVNATFCQALRGVSESIIGKSLEDVWGPETFNNHIKPSIDKCFKGSTIRYEASFTTPQAGKRYFEVIFRPFPVDSGEISHLLAETFDITDLKLKEKFAIEKEEEFKRFETNLPIGFMRCGADGKIIHVNRALLMIMDCDSEDQLRATNLRDYYNESGIFDLHLERLTDNKPKSFGRVPLKTYKGNEIVCRISGYMALNESGETEYIDFAFEDSSHELMLESRLLEAQKLETIGALAGGIAHDFNNILATISGYSELLKEDIPKSSPSSEKVSKIMLAVSKARSLTNQILTFSRQLEQEKVTVNVHDVLRETVGFVRSVAPPKIKIKSNFRKKNTPVLADPTQLFRVFLNLMTNAIQAMEEKGGVISVNLSLILDKEIIRRELNRNIVADEYILVSIKDTGKGMDPSLIRRIFEPFFTTRTVGKGSGLGLSVVHGIVNEIGGEVLVSSEQDIGSEFYVYLPVSREIRKMPGIEGQRKKILFISGNKYESRIMSLALESTGYEMILVHDVNDFLNKTVNTDVKPDLIIYMCDSEIVKCDDFTAICNNPDFKVPCILISESDKGLLHEKLVISGIIRQHLVKPVSLKEIKDAIQLSVNQ